MSAHPIWQAEPENEAQAAKLFAEPLWRLNHVYGIVDREGRELPFRMNAPQLAVARAVYEEGARRIVVLKARQLGFSTLFALMGLDTVLWARNRAAALCADTFENAKKIFRTKVRFAYEALPEPLKAGAAAIRCSESVLELENGGTLRAATRVRGGTYQFLHISELGKIAHKDPDRAREIRSGAFPSVPSDGVIAVESTFEGGRGGVFYELIKAAQETPENARSPLDFRLMFFPWYGEPAYALDDGAEKLPADIEAYFARLSAETGRTFSLPQRRWYAKQKALLGDDVFREYPSCVEEAFSANVDGAIYAEEIAKLRARGRIAAFDWDPAYAVHTFWDLGYGDTTAIWFVQFIGREIHFIDYYENGGVPCETYARAVLAKPYGTPFVYLPHDAGAHEKGSGLSYAEQLARAGLRSRIIPRTRDQWLGINRLRSLLSRAYFHSVHCARGLDCLEAYHKRKNAASGVFEEKPVHDWSSNAADAARYVAEALEAGLVENGEALESARERAETLPKTAIMNRPRR